MTWPVVKVAGDPVFAAVSVQFHAWPTTAEPLTLLALLSVRSEASAMAHSENELTPPRLTKLFVVSGVPPCAVHVVPPTFFHRTNRDSVIVDGVSSPGSM